MICVSIVHKWPLPRAAKETEAKGTKRPGMYTIRTQLQLPKREISKITNSQNTKRTHGKPSEQLFPQKASHSGTQYYEHT